MHYATFANKKASDDEYDEYSELLEIAELAASAHTLQHGHSPLELARFLMKLDREHISGKRETKSELESMTDIVLDTMHW